MGEKILKSYIGLSRCYLAQPIQLIRLDFIVCVSKALKRLFTSSRNVLILLVLQFKTVSYYIVCLVHFPKIGNTLFFRNCNRQTIYVFQHYFYTKNILPVGILAVILNFVECVSFRGKIKLTLKALFDLYQYH